MHSFYKRGVGKMFNQIIQGVGKMFNKINQNGMVDQNLGCAIY